MPETSLNPAYRIRTARLLIRCWEPTDAVQQKVSVDANRPHLLPWMPWAAGEPESLEAHIQRIRQWRGNFDHDRDFVYAIFDREETRLLGGTGLHARVGERALEIGYWIDWQHRRQGFATEASAALTRVGFEIHRVNRMEIHCDPRNTPSAAVPARLGYTLDGTLRQRLMNYDGQWTDLMTWSLLEAEYPGSPSAAAALEAYDAAGRKILG
jgi:RimJ/RimL family protein N-acetyltransferase